MGRNPSQRDILQPVFTKSDISVPNLTTRIHSSRTASTFVLFINLQIIYTSWNLIFDLKFTYKIITPWEIKSRSQTIWRSVFLCLIHTFRLKCLIQYFDTFCLKLSENFNSFHFSHTINYTSLHSNITDFPLTYHIRVSCLELYVHRITFSISGQ